MQMNTLISATIIIALLSSWIILFMGKTGFREYIIIHSAKYISQLFSCDFCLSWWICLALSVWAVAITGNIDYIICAFIATPITRVLI